MARASRTYEQASTSKPKWSRDWIIVGLFAVFIIAIIARLGYVQIFKAEEYSGLADKSHIVTLTVPAKRGTIYDRNGEVLASSIEATTIYADPTEVTDPAALSTALEKHLGEKYNMDYQDFYSLVTTRNTSFVYIKRKADKKIAAELKEDLSAAGLMGVHYLEDTKRIYPNNSTASQVVGVIDVDGKGIAGLEMHYNSLVGGQDGKKEIERGGGDIPISNGVIVEEPAVDGKDIVTSLDIKLQQKVETRLKKALSKYSAKLGSATVMDAATGEIYAICSYSKTKGAGGQTEYALDNGKIWSVSDAYEPGSTFKAITASSILKNSKVNAKTTFGVPASLKVYDATIKDAHDHDAQTMTFRDIIADSSNIGMVLASRKVSHNQLYKTFTNFGFGSNPGTDFPGVSSGYLEKPKDWDGVQAANVTFGQGLLATGLQIVRAYGALEQKGTMRVPHFLMDVPLDSGKAAELTKDLKKTKKACSAKNAKNVTSLLKSVVTRGTGEDAAIDRFNVVGKTGTAEIITSSGKYGNTYNLSFCGWLEGSSSDLVCLVTIETADIQAGSGTICGNVFQDIMEFAIERYRIYPNAEEA